MVVHQRVDHQLVGAVVGHDLLERRSDSVGRSDDDAPAGERIDARFPRKKVQSSCHCRQWAELPALGERDRHAPARGVPLRLVVGLGADNADRNRDLRLLQSPGRREPLAVEQPGWGACGVDEVGHRIGQAELRRPDRALG